MILDVHGYCGTWPYWPLRGGGPEAMLSAMDRCGIGRVYLASLKAAFADCRDGNAEMAALVARHPERFSPAFSFSPWAPGRESFRDDLLAAEKPLVKLFPISQGYEPLEEPFVAELLEFCGAQNIPVMVPHRLMMSWRLPRYPIGNIGVLAGRHPRTKLVIASVNYVLELQSALDVLRRCPNVFLETSGMMALREIEQVAGWIGAERLLHGSALPLQTPAIGPLKVHIAQIDDDAKERILWRNAVESLGLAAPCGEGR